MEISKTTIAVVAASCITAGAAGAFLANRPSTLPPSAQTAPVEGSALAGVEQSEAIVSDVPAPQAPALAPAPPVAQAAPAPTPTAKSSGRTQPKASASVRPARPEPRRESSAPARSEQIARATPVEPRPATPAAVEPIKPISLDPPVSAAPPSTRFVDLVVSADSVLGLQMETSLTSEHARVEDEVVARVTRDVRVGDRVAIPAGSKARGEVTLVERGGKVKDKARLGIRFTSVVLADGTRVPLETETIYREGEGPGGESAAKIGGGAIGGAIIGGIFGGAKGAAIGGSAGAGAGTAAVMAGGRNAATFPSGTPVTVRVVKPATVTVEEQ